jgi:hypothetical protein
MNRAIGWLALALVVGCRGGALPPEPSEPAVGFAADIRPFFDAKCTHCHGPGNLTHVDLTQPFEPDAGVVGRPNTWTGAGDKPLVDPGRPENSFLVDKIERTDLEAHEQGSPMPCDIPLLTPAEIQALRTWISAGAADDAFYQQNITRILGDGLHLGSRSGKCSFCHTPQSRFGPDVTRPWDPIRGLVGVASTHGGFRVVAGNPDASVLIKKVEGDPSVGDRMPLHLPRVTEEELNLVKRWISAGAAND